MVQNAPSGRSEPFLPDASMSPERVVGLLIGATVEEIERELILQTLASCDGNRTHAARILGMSLRTLRYKIRHYSANGIGVPAHN